MATKKYLEDTYLFELDTKIIAIAPVDSCKHGSHRVILEESLFHPQGGGQPSDQGQLFVLGSTEPAFDVTFSVMDQTLGLVHYGTPHCDIEVGANVHIVLDKAARVLHARLHSAGHAIDAAMQRLGYPSTVFKPLKGYHFQDNPHVEYELQNGAVISDEELNQLPGRLNQMLEELVGMETVVEVVDKETATDILQSNLDGYPDTVRIVTIAGSKCPCGGTHVNNTTELGTVTVTKIKKKKNNFKVSYVVEER